jgi:hypothetical protein
VDIVVGYAPVLDLLRHGGQWKDKSVRLDFDLQTCQPQVSSALNSRLIHRYQLCRSFWFFSSKGDWQSCQEAKRCDQAGNTETKICPDTPTTTDFSNQAKSGYRSWSWRCQRRSSGKRKRRSPGYRNVGQWTFCDGSNPSWTFYFAFGFGIC